MAELSPLEQVKRDAERLTLKRIEEEAEKRAWQESKDGPVSLDDGPEVAVEEVEAPKAEAEPAVTKKKGKN